MLTEREKNVVFVGHHETALTFLFFKVRCSDFQGFLSRSETFISGVFCHLRVSGIVFNPCFDSKHMIVNIE